MSQPLPRHRRHEERERRTQKLAELLIGEDRAQAIVDTAPAHVEAGGLVLPGEAQVMRCIPICARGVPGLIPGTNPLAAYIREETRLERLRLRL